MNNNSAFLYQRRLERRYPGLFVILLDQSNSMNDTVEDQSQGFAQPFKEGNKPLSKADVAIAAVNTIIFQIITGAGEERDGKTKKSAYISVLGYNDVVKPLLVHIPRPVSSSSNQVFYPDDPIDIQTLSTYHHRTVTMRHFAQTEGGLTSYESNQPIWIEKEAQGYTEMAAAFASARDIVTRWLRAEPEEVTPGGIKQAKRSECFPPVIINISDGENTGKRDPLAIANEIRRLHTADGNVLIFNCHFGIKQGVSTLFPGKIEEVSNLDQKGLAEKMFEMSSPIPEMLHEGAAKIRRKWILPDARCYVYNADPDILIKFLQWGTLGVANRAR
jgi:hypothetical protein